MFCLNRKCNKDYMILQCFINLLTNLQINKPSFFPVRFNTVSLFYEVYNYSSYCWVPVKTAIKASMLEFFWLERENFHLLGGLLPETLTKKFSLQPLDILHFSSFLNILEPLVVLLKNCFVNMRRIRARFLRSFIGDAFSTSLNAFEGLVGPLTSLGVFLVPSYDKEVNWVFI